MFGHLSRKQASSMISHWYQRLLLLLLLLQGFDAVAMRVEPSVSHWF
jgi:hypothetical protein